MMDLVVATQNAGKLKEIRRLLEGTGIQVQGLDLFPGAPEVVEDGDTFAENARKKAQTIARHTGQWTLADDSGLVVEALGGQPGVRSARYAGEDASDADNNAKLLTSLQGVAEGQRLGAFCCVLALCSPQGECHFFEGRLEGRMTTSPSGSGGFGYDPLFWVPQFGKTLAELPLETKNSISHRGQALRQAIAYIRQHLL